MPEEWPIGHTSEGSFSESSSGSSSDPEVNSYQALLRKKKRSGTAVGGNSDEALQRVRTNLAVISSPLLINE